MAEKLLHITLSTHNFAITRFTPRMREVLMGFARQNVQYGLVRVPGGKFLQQPTKVFGAASANRDEFRFHINQYQEFLAHLKMSFVNETMYDVSTKPVPNGTFVDFEIKDKREPYEDQPLVIEYLESDNPNRSRFVDLQTGKGKTFCSLKGIGTFSKRTVIIVKPMYMEKWAQDVNEAFFLEPEDVVMVRGSAHLMALINQGKENLITAKFIIVSNRTMQDYLKLYELHRSGVLDLGYDCLPEDFFEVVGAGMRLIDEVHQDFHLNYKLDLYTNIERSISLSATLLNNDPFLTKMYRIAYPIALRYAGSKLDKYVVARAVMYGLQPKTNVRTTYMNNPAYSHAAFEDSILKSPMLRDAYFKIIWNIVEIGFMKDYKKGERCAVFCSSVDMCTAFSNFLIKKYPDLDVRRYVQEDDYSNLKDPDIRVTTILSGGTAHDIAMLKTVILTIAVDSLQANIQTLGRLRKLKDIVTKFYYMVCTDIPKHLQYHRGKERMLAERAASYQIINSPYLL